MLVEGEHGAYSVRRGLPEDAHFIGAEVKMLGVEMVFAHPTFAEVLVDASNFRSKDLFALAKEINLEW